VGPVARGGDRLGEERGIPIPVKKASPYSIDENLWGRTAECGILEDPWETPPEEVFERSAALADTPDEVEELVLRFERGLPVAVDGKELPLAELVAEVDRRAGAHGVGRIDLVEDRLVGIKSREIYECPGAMTILTAHRDLEDLCLEQELAAGEARPRGPLRPAHLQRPVVLAAQGRARRVHRDLSSASSPARSA
jgi:argininosuccinate synthase